MTGTFKSALAVCLLLGTMGSAAAQIVTEPSGDGTVFTCESGNTVIVQTGTGPDGQGVRLDYLEQSFELYPVQATPGRFATEQGLRPDHGLEWISEGEEGRLSELPLDHAAPDPLPIETCVLSTATGIPPADASEGMLPVGVWRLTALGGTPVDPAIEPFITFNMDGSVNGNTGCNVFGSQATLTPQGISIANSFMTRIGCEEERHVVERAFLDALEHADIHNVDGQTLELFDSDGALLASFDLISADPTGMDDPGIITSEVSEGSTLFRNVRIFDGTSSELSEPSDVLIEDNIISRISTDPIDIGSADVTVIEGEGRTLMPGLIDAHWHTMLVGVPPDPSLSSGYFNLVAGVQAEATLMRGFTTVRDLGGASFDLKHVIDIGMIPGPRIYPSGAMITVTSGHGDFRSFSDLPRTLGVPQRMEELGMAMLADSPDEMRVRVREQLMQGASQIKLTAGGGVASPFSPLDIIAFTPEELRAAVEAAENWGTYVGVHAYTPETIQGAIEAGVRVIEHGQLMDEETAQMIADNDVWLSLQPFDAHSTAAAPESSRDKLQEVLDGTGRAYELARQYDLKVAFGTDILFSPVLAQAQGAMMLNLLEWYTPAEILQMATGTNGELLLLSGNRNPYPGRLGVVEEGALADLLLVDGNPLENLALVATPETSFVIIMKDGLIYKNLL